MTACVQRKDARGTVRFLWQLVPLQRDIIKIVAFLAMAGDHIATAFHVGTPWLNLTGRCAFPLFALMAGCNLAGRQIRQTAVNRLWLMAVLAQPVFWLAFRGTGNQWWELNILFCFAVVMQAVCFWQRPDVIKGAITGTMLALYLPFSTASYGWQGLVMLLAAVSVWQVAGAVPGAVIFTVAVLCCMAERCKWGSPRAGRYGHDTAGIVSCA
ncbi:type-F conjugative transfer system pilin acetylase TraX (plasmid) [Escherichia coli]|nr:type-F conjugative transfer system pilin acetylase TraX [Escherichia coli]